MKKIGILVYDVSVTGGAERVAIKLASELANLYEVHLISMFKEKKELQETIKKYYSYVVSEKTVSMTRKMFSLSKRVKNYLQSNQIELLLVITAGVNTIATLATKNTSIKTVYCEHSNLENRTYGKKHEVRQYIGAKYLNKVVTLTQRDKENFIKQYKLPESKVMVIPNWIEDIERNQTYSKNSKSIISVGRLEKVKGYDMLIEVAKQVQQKHKEWHWDIYGEGKYRGEIEREIKENNLEQFVILKGNVADLDKRYREYAIFVLTSYYEGFPLVLLEAQKGKLPIVSFDCPTGPSEIVRNSENGFIIPTYHINEMAEKINELIENGDERQEFSNNSQKYLKQFGKENILRKWIDLIENL